MLFHLRMEVEIPRSEDEQRVRELRSAELAMVKELQQAGKWLQIWRIAGQQANFSILDVTDADELHRILTSLPLYPYLKIDVTALCRHPAALP